MSVDLGDGLTMYSSPPPGSGVVLAYILNILENYAMSAADADDPVTYQRIAEAFKWGYARRSELGDPFDPDYTQQILDLAANMTSEEWAFEAFSLINDTATSNDTSFYGAQYDISSDHGTSHVAVIAPNGDAVSATSTHNLQFGGKFMSPSTGVILNNEMDDFSYPGQTNEWGVEPSPSNYPIPGKRPMSSMAPAIFVDADGNAKLVTGAAGGTQITTAIAYVSIS